MAYAVLFGSNLYVGTTGVLTVTDEDPSTGQDKSKEFFRIREIDRKRSLGSYLVVDCDIKDPDGNREVKLFKSKPVAGSAEVEVLNLDKAVEVRRADGNLVIKVEELDRDDLNVPDSGPVARALEPALEKVEAILRITGDFQAGPHRVKASTTQLQIGGLISSGNLMIGGGGLHLSHKISF